MDSSTAQSIFVAVAFAVWIVMFVIATKYIMDVERKLDDVKYNLIRRGEWKE